jgi:hypothetical protein
VELRPAFKRLASQTLGPEYSKRAFFGFNAEEEDERGQTAGWSIMTPEMKRQELNEFGGGSKVQSFGSIAERRRRRMSAPSPGVEKEVGGLGYAPAG